MTRELAAGKCVIARTEHFIALTAYALRYAYEFWVLPLAHIGEIVAGYATAMLARHSG